ncbi:MAG: hypothetical protein A2V45_07115 [Candidatus Aminicenantes bacterium RBG_19FT_COMBO_58_17]|nr:MAG: hypothetical protein A2V45_07115 [Candidatus Aminicenantes bacterium RBG_19FT_COMBO_58_17]
MFCKGVSINGDFKAEEEAAEKISAIRIGLFDDDGVFPPHSVHIGECRAEHGVDGNEPEAGFSVAARNLSFDRGHVAEEALRVQEGKNGLENLDSCAERDGIDQQARPKQGQVFEGA